MGVSTVYNQIRGRSILGMVIWSKIGSELIITYYFIRLNRDAYKIIGYNLVSFWSFYKYMLFISDRI